MILNRHVNPPHGTERALGEEQITGKAADRAYWAPLRAELERVRHDLRREAQE